MIFKPAIIDLKHIDAEDRTFKITTRSQIDDILPSIQSLGIINPPILKKNNEKYSIISGFRRIAACLHTEKEDVEVKIIGPDTGIIEMVKIAITDNSMQRPLNLVEASRALVLLSDCIDDEITLTKTSELLGLPDNVSLINKIKRISFLPGEVQEAVAKGFILLAMAIELHRLGDEEAIFFTKLFQELKIGLNKQREILTMSQEIAHREEITVLDVFNDRSFQKLIHDSDMDGVQKGRKIRQYLKARRFPEITKAENTFNTRLKTLKMGKDLKLVPPQSFEGQYFSLHLQFKDLSELKKQGEMIDGLIRNPAMKDILAKR